MDFFKESRTSPLGSYPSQKDRGMEDFVKMLPLFEARISNPVAELKLAHRIVTAPRMVRSGERFIKGHFRKMPAQVSVFEEKSKIATVYRPPDNSIEELMEFLGQQYTEAKLKARDANQKLLALAFFNVWTHIIHPFTDGNTLALQALIP